MIGLRSARGVARSCKLTTFPIGDRPPTDKSSVAIWSVRQKGTILVGVYRAYTNDHFCASFMADSPDSGMVYPHRVGLASHIRNGNFVEVWAAGVPDLD
jgi:hypothetical protein